MFVILEASSSGFECPQCNNKLGVESWGTEYGNPLPGIFEVYCPCCSKIFNIEVEVCVNIVPLR